MTETYIASDQGIHEIRRDYSCNDLPTGLGVQSLTGSRCSIGEKPRFLLSLRGSSTDGSRSVSTSRSSLAYLVETRRSTIGVIAGR